MFHVHLHRHGHRAIQFIQISDHVRIYSRSNYRTLLELDFFQRPFRAIA